MKAGWVPWVVLTLLLVAFPAAPSHFDTQWMMHAFCVSAWLVLWVPRLWRTPTLRCGAPALLVGLALLSLLAALLLAPDGIPRAEQRWAALTGGLHAALFLLALGMFPGPDAPAAQARRAALGLCALLLAMCLVQIVRGLLLAPWGEPDTRLSGTLGNPNSFGALMAAAALVVAGTGYALARQAIAPAIARRRRVLAMALSAPLLVALLGSRSRGAAAALLVTLALLALRWRRLRLLAAVAAAVLLVLLVPNPLGDRLTHLQPDHVFTRPFLWSTALGVAGEHPVGIGPAMYKYVFPALALDPERPWLLHQRHEVGLTHNVFLTLAVEWGWLAAAALLGLLAWSAVRVLRAPDGRRDPLRLGATLGACVLLLELQVDGIEQNQLLFTVFLVLVAAALARLPRSAGPAVPGKDVALACLVAGLATGGLALWREQGYAKLAEANARAARWTAHDDPAPVRAAFEVAAAALPGELGPWRDCLTFEANVLKRVLDTGPAKDSEALARALDAVHADSEAAVRCNGVDPEPRWQGALLDLLVWRRTRYGPLFERYVTQAQAALRLDPLDVEGHFALAQEAHGNGDRQLADEEFDQVFRLEPDHAYAWAVRSVLLERDGADEEALYALVRAKEAVANDRIKAGVASPRSREFFEELLRKVDLGQIRTHIAELRRKLYF
ncbi:MAG TPA: O-antigen ligase family protein [Planctomycetota bacterium]|nr:O-antigen ligase family protein [Planctomycetota bacterium]